jgi:hypothetical protein
VTDASYGETPATSESSGNSGNATQAKVHKLADREMMITVDGDVNDIKVPLVEAPANKSNLP